MEYLFTSERLGFRNWIDSDIDKMTAVSADPEVMEFFPSVKTKAMTEDFIKNMKSAFEKKGYCYYPVEILDTKEFIGFIGLIDQTYNSPFTPNVDVGYRLGKAFWGKGYATEGAKRCIEYGFNDLGLEKIIAIASESNIKSTHVMKKVGMNLSGSFKHPKLEGFPHLEMCFCYEICK